MQISGIKISNYKSFGSEKNLLRFDLERCLALVGKNESGKTNTLNALKDINQRKKNDSFAFNIKNDMDLFLAFHSIDIGVIGEKLNNKWNLRIILFDVYDYTEEKSMISIFKQKLEYIANWANNVAVKASKRGVLNSYYVTIEFELKDYEV
jgi:predicted ATP-dependent endonuclease of OLD family